MDDRKAPTLVATLEKPHIEVTYRVVGVDGYIRTVTVHYWTRQAAREAMDLARWHGHQIINVTA